MGLEILSLSSYSTMPIERDSHAWPLLQQNDLKESTNRRRAPPTPLILSISNVVPQHCSIKKIERRRRERKEIGSPLMSLRSPMDRERERGRTRSPRAITAALGLTSPGEMFILYEPKHYQIKKCPPPKVPEGAAAPPVERRASNDTDSLAVDLVRGASLQRRARTDSPASRYSGSTAEGSAGSPASISLSSNSSSVSSSTLSSIPSPDIVILVGNRAAYVQLPSLPAPCAGPSTHRIQVQHKGGAVWRRM